ncbi:MAG TPA: type II toxin-antitoxin system VapC family toxin [Amycolatopsis sp.]|uniref:type II toxin-antitoxin system VapC family toxin n=1 Tax=Amycolatopsis sp. TaxID=37632 RepID=UPI002B4A78A6|nr:type II toxin-antitoxin system VapC family toxin [Amycolatopsis sp.]HKS49322.1 type II toxin-antitoxin system VapC family toxin [Amycolatopsis sp.]
MGLYYIDASAAVKLLREEEHSKSFAAFYDTRATSSWVSSDLLRIELIRAVSRVLPAMLPNARELVLAFDYVGIDDDIVDAAMNEPDRTLRSLDAIHLATARVLGEELDGFVTYDDRLAAAVTDAGFTVISPRD